MRLAVYKYPLNLTTGRQLNLLNGRSVLLNFMISEAADEMVVNHPDCLHIGIASGRPEKRKAVLFKYLAELV